MGVITISRQYGCSIDKFVNTLAERAGNYKVFDKDVLKHLSLYCDVPEDELKYMDEENFSLFKSIVKKYFDFDVFKDVFKMDLPVGVGVKEITDNMDYHTYNTVYDSSSAHDIMRRYIDLLANSDDVVIVGRGGQALLRGRKDTFHFRLVANYADRMECLRQSEPDKSETYYANKMAEVEGKKSKYIKHFFDCDISDPTLYHATLNMSMLTDEQAADIICNLLK